VPNKSIPTIGDSNWGIPLNAHLAQLQNPINGGINTFEQFSSRPNNLTTDDVGKTYLYTQTGNLHQWTGTTWKVLNESVINVKDYGAIGDGVADDYEAIQKAVAIINQKKGGNLVFPKATYRINKILDRRPVTGSGDNFQFTDCNNLIIEGNNSKIDSNGQFTRTNDYDNGDGTYYYSYLSSIGFSFNNCSNFTLRNIELDGNADKTTKAFASLYEGFSNGIAMFKCFDFTLENIFAHHYHVDGFVTYGGPADLTERGVINNCKFWNNGRQGASPTCSRHLTFNSCSFNYTGQTGLYGSHSPTAGVDIEPDIQNSQNGNIYFNNCEFKDNLGFQFICSNQNSTPNPILLIGCHFESFEGNPYNGVHCWAKYTQFLNCTYLDAPIVPGYGNGNIDIYTEIVGCKITSTKFFATQIAPGTPLNKTIFRNNNFYLLSPAPLGYGHIYLQSEGVIFEDNTIFVSATEHDGGVYTINSLLQNAKSIKNNRWVTDLTTPNKFFTISYSGSNVENEIYETSGKFSPGTVLMQDTFSTINKQNKYQSTFPNIGTWNNGDQILNTNPTPGGYVGWICTVSGTPGTWKGFGLIEV
jgi:Pectate lyase superfamily protein